MDEDVKAILLDIAAQLKERNDMTKKQTDESRERIESLSDMRERLGIRSEDFKKRMSDSEERQAHLDNDRIELRKRSEEDRAQRTQFQADLIQELRRLNANFEAFITRGVSL